MPQFWWQLGAYDSIGRDKEKIVIQPFEDYAFPEEFRAGSNKPSSQEYNFVRMELSGEPVKLPEANQNTTDEKRGRVNATWLDNVHSVIKIELSRRKLQHATSVIGGGNTVFYAHEDRALLDHVTSANGMQIQADIWSRKFVKVPESLKRDNQKDADGRRGAAWDQLRASAKVAMGLYGVLGAKQSLNENRRDPLKKQPWLILTESFLPDLFGNVVSLHARNGSIAYFNVDHIFPHSLGGLTQHSNMLALSVWSDNSKGRFLFNTCVSVRVERSDGILDRYDLFPGENKDWSRSVLHGFRWHHLMKLWKMLSADGESYLLELKDEKQQPRYKDPSEISGQILKVFLCFLDYALCHPLGAQSRGGLDMPLQLGNAIPHLLEQLQQTHPYINRAKQEFLTIVRNELTKYPASFNVEVEEVNSGGKHFLEYR